MSASGLNNVIILCCWYSYNENQITGKERKTEKTPKLINTQDKPPNKIGIKPDKRTINEVPRSGCSKTK